MIELLWKDFNANCYRAMNDVATLFTWLTATLLDYEKNKKEGEESIYLQGYTVIWDGVADVPAVLILSNSTDVANQERLLKILQQPPGEFKGKYVACILSQEPESVKEIESDEGSSSSVEIEIEDDEDEKT